MDQRKSCEDSKRRAKQCTLLCCEIQPFETITFYSTHFIVNMKGLHPSLPSSTSVNHLCAPRHILLTLHQIRDAQTILEGPCGCRFPTNQAQTHTVWPVSCQKTYISWFSELCLVCFFHIPLASHQLTITFFLGGCWTKITVFLPVVTDWTSKLLWPLIIEKLWSFDL